MDPFHRLWWRVPAIISTVNPVEFDQMEMQKYLYTAIEVYFDDFCFRETIHVRQVECVLDKDSIETEIVDRPVHT